MKLNKDIFQDLEDLRKSIAEKKVDNFTQEMKDSIINLQKSIKM